MALFENFPYTDLHNLNMDWLIEQFKVLESSNVLSVNGQTGQVVLYQAKNVEFPSVTDNNWSIVRMADGTLKGIYFGADNKAYLVSGDTLDQVFTANNPPAYPVQSVNGKTGAVVLYDTQYTELPRLTDEEMHNWNIFRRLNNVIRGIQFEDDGTAYIMDGSNRYPIYTEHTQPPYPVQSVNGKTGGVSLFTDVNGDIKFPDFVNQNYEGWILYRSVNGTNLGIQFNSDGTCDFKIGSDTYKIYTENNPPADFVDNSALAIMKVKDNTTASTWGLIRQTSTGDVGIIFDYSSAIPSAFMQYKVNNQTHTIKLLTNEDIPSGSGVVSVNGKTGAVSIYATDITMSETDNRTIPEAITNIKELVTVVEDEDTATQNISEGTYVIWKNTLYTASTAIVIGDTLSTSNLTPANTTIYNEIKKLFNKLDIKVYTLADLNTVFDSVASGITINTLEVVKTEFIIDFYIAFSYNQSITVPDSGNFANIAIGELNVNFSPASFHGAKLTAFDDSFKPEVIVYAPNMALAGARASSSGYTIPANTLLKVQGTYITDH